MTTHQRIVGKNLASLKSNWYVYEYATVKHIYILTRWRIIQVHDEYNPLALHPDFLDIEKLQFMIQICRKSNSILSKTDSARRFLMSYYLHDGTISIFEQKNSTLGMSGGKYLERQKVYCHVNSKEVGPMPFFLPEIEGI